jgi:hypothetical protein
MSDEMRISKGADRAVGKYMETFVREAVARAAFERAGEKELGGGFMEVSFSSFRLLFSISLSKCGTTLAQKRPGSVVTGEESWFLGSEKEVHVWP